MNMSTIEIVSIISLVMSIVTFVCIILMTYFLYHILEMQHSIREGIQNLEGHKGKDRKSKKIIDEEDITNGIELLNGNGFKD